MTPDGHSPVDRSDVQADDLVVRCLQRAVPAEQHAWQFFTIHRYATDEMLGGPFSTMQVAIDLARRRGAEEGVGVWLETAPDSNDFWKIS